MRRFARYLYIRIDRGGEWRSGTGAVTCDTDLGPWRHQKQPRPLVVERQPGIPHLKTVQG